MNSNFDNVLVHFVPFVLKQAHLEKGYKVCDYDLDRVYLEIEGEKHTYTIRMWDITGKYIRYTLFEDIPETHSGKALLESQYYFIS